MLTSLARIISATAVASLLLAAVLYGGYDPPPPPPAGPPPLEPAGFDAAAERLIARCEEVARRSLDWDQTRALGALASPADGFTFRLDDHLDAATVSGSAPPTTVAPLAAITFEGSAGTTLTGPGCAVEAGVLKCNSGGVTLTTTDELGLPFAQLGWIEIRARHTTGRLMQLAWFRAGEPREELGRLNVDLVADGRLQVYAINVTDVWREGVSRGDRLGHLELTLSDRAEDRPELDSLRLLSPRAAYATERAGVTYATKARETRRVLHLGASASVTYRVTLPPGEPRLSFGGALLEGPGPVSFEVEVEGRTLLRRTISGGNAWHDLEVELAPWASTTVALTLHASGGDEITLWSNPVIATAAKKPLHVLMILEDALRADHLSAYGYARPTSPHREALARQGVLFEHAFAQATKTRPSCPTIMTSLYASATGVWTFQDRLADRYLTLAEILRHQGYATASFIQNGNAGPLAGLHQGFGQVFDRLERDSAALYGDRVVDWLDRRRDRNAFVYLHLLDPHGPYAPPADLRHWATPTGEAVRWNALRDPSDVREPTVEDRRGRYDGEVAQNDRLFGLFWQRLAQLQLTDQTLVMFLSDHGEHLGEHGQWDHQPPGYRQVLHVPLIMAHPELLPAGERIATPVQNIDILPTILELAGIPREPFLLHGESLVPLIRGEPLAPRLVLSEEVVSQPKRETLIPWSSLFFGEFHILTSEHIPTFAFRFRSDPEETHAIAVGNPEQLQRPVRAVQTANQKLWRQLAAGAGAAVDSGTQRIESEPEVTEELRALGYLEPVE